MDATQTNQQLGELFDKVEEVNKIAVAVQDYNRASTIGKLMIEHHTNDQGELLAHVHETQGFQEVYDFKGGEKRRWRLERKAEQIHR